MGAAPKLEDLELLRSNIRELPTTGETPGSSPDPLMGIDPEKSHQLGNAVEDMRWLITELGSRGLSGVFMRGEAAVFTPVIGEDGYVAPIREDDNNGPATIRPCTPASVVTRLALNYFVYKLKKIGDDTVPVEAWFPTAAAEHALDALDQAINLRTLRGVTHTPMARKDGTILYAAGFDDDSGFLHIPTVDVRPVNPNPTPGEVAESVALLRGMVDQFAWAGPHDEANYLGLLLTPLLRELCPPPYKLGAIMARQPGSGKSLLNEILRTVHGGVFRSEMPHDDAELAKSLTSVLTCTTAPVVQFDNVSGTLRSSRLAGLLTSPTYSDRVLGSTNNVDMVNDRLWTVTGNNLSFGGDLVRRTIWVTIDPGCPNPEERTGFKLHLPTWTAENRGEILHALLTLIAAWTAAGRPMVERSSDSYARWSGVVRGILTNAGVPGEFDHQESAQQKVGTDDEGWGDFLQAIRAAFGNRTFTTGELIQKMQGAGFKDDVAQGLIDALPPDLHEKYLRAHESATAIKQSLGKWLRNRNGRWAMDLVCDAAGMDRAKNVPLWRVRNTNEPAPKAG